MNTLNTIRTCGGLILLLALAFLGGLAVLYATPRSAALDSDSICFIDAARHAAKGSGLFYGDPNHPRPLVHWPPLYPGLLGILSVYGPDPMVSARWVGAFFFAADILLIGLVLLIYTARSFWIPILGSALALASLSLLTAHTVVWTEQPFIFLTLLGLVVLARYLQQPRWLLMAPAILFVGFAVLARYAGFVLIATGAACVLAWARESRRARVRDAAIFAFGSALPIALWMVRNLHYGGTATNRGLSWHPIEWAEVTRMFWTFAHWIFPGIMPTDAWRVCLGLAGAALGALVFFAVRKRKSDSASGPAAVEAAPSPLELLPRVLVAFACVYVSFLIISISLFDVSTPMSDRILLPIFPVGLILVLCLLFRAIQRARVRKPIYVTAMVFLLGAVVIDANARQTGEWIDRVRWRGAGIESLAWAQGGIVSLASALPDNPIIYTNGGAALSFLTGTQRARTIPQKRIPHSGPTLTEDPNYPKALKAMATAMEKQNAKLVLMYWYSFREHLATIDELKHDLPLRLVASVEDGAIYEWDPDQAQSRRSASGLGPPAP